LQEILTKNQRANEKRKIMKTRNSTQNVVKLTIYYLAFATLLIVSGCNKDEKTPDCGCDSPITKTIPETANLTGEIWYHKQSDPKDDYYINKYWIVYNDPNCLNCHKMIVCNEEILSAFSDLKSLPSEKAIKIKFSGHLKDVCKKRFDIAENTIEHIVLTKIERQ
jgi:hypothetical protein